MRLFALLMCLVVVVGLTASSASAERRMARSIAGDLQNSARERSCLRYNETRGKSQPYVALNDQGSGAKGAYQYMDGTWQYVLAVAEVYYGVEISSARDARSASPLAQDIVTAFAVEHPQMLDHRPWPYCY